MMDSIEINTKYLRTKYYCCYNDYEKVELLGLKRPRIIIEQVFPRFIDEYDKAHLLCKEHINSRVLICGYKNRKYGV